MERSFQSVSKVKKRSAVRQIEDLHPYKTILYLSMMGSGVLFFFLVLLYSLFEASSIPSVGVVPKVFVVSTVVLMASGYLVSGILSAFRKEKLKRVRDLLLVTMICGVAFTLLQMVGWYQLYDTGVFFNGKQGDSYLYLISGIHIAHLIVGVFILSYLYAQYRKNAGDPVKELVVITNPYERTKLEIATGLWHFIDVVWIVLFFYFFLTIS